MSFSIGLDTGGTFTDAVIFDDEQGVVIAKAKSLTTRHDLAIGIAGATGKVIEQANIEPAMISMVSISTTLATNALVEGQGGRACLVMIGFEPSDLKRAGLQTALGSDPVVFLRGGHDVHGKPKPLDLSALEGQLDGLADTVSAFAVAGMFAVRNPDHEIKVRDLICARTDRAVTCSHELSSKLDGPKRALTTLLNARLIDMIARLIGATSAFLESRHITAPLMVVRGDGSLVSASFALNRPIETILSGPAASLIGAQFLTARDNAIVSDIGGTTTDIAILENGRPRIDEKGASVGGFCTMVDAVAMRTYGLGGDSEVKINEGTLAPEISLGPRRLVPISLLATMDEKSVMETLHRQLGNYAPSRNDGRFALTTGVADHLKAGLTKSQQAVLERLTDKPQALDVVLQGTAEIATLDGLAARGLALIGGITPSDAQHFLGVFDHWHGQAAALALQLFVRKKDGSGNPFALDEGELALRIVERLKRLSAERILETSFFEDGLDGAALMPSPLVKRALNRDWGVARMAILLDRPLVGLGAGARAYYSDTSAILGVECIVPQDADVANAIGAVVGQVRVTVEAEIIQNDQMMFEVTGTGLDLEQKLFAHEIDAIKAAKAACDAAVRVKALAAGAASVEVVFSEDLKSSSHDGMRHFISATITATAKGRPAHR